MSDTTYDNLSAQHSEDSTPSVAAEQAKGVASDVKESGAQVAGTAKDETIQVATEAKEQAKDLFYQVRGEMSEQTSAQQHRAAGGLRTLADELAGMAQNSEQSGVASDLARQASQRVRTVAGWMEEREPGDLVAELKGFARRKPGTFLAAAVAVGLLGGRLTRGLTADQKDASQPGGQSPEGSQDGGVARPDEWVRDHATRLRRRHAPGDAGPGGQRRPGRTPRGADGHGHEPRGAGHLHDRVDWGYCDEQPAGILG